jgi:hypothetical protein
VPESKENVVDSLLVSLGLDTDDDSFNRAHDAVKEVKNSILQLSAAAGVSIGFKAVTKDLADTVQTMTRLYRATGLSIDKILMLKHSFRLFNGNGEDAISFINKMNDLYVGIRDDNINEGMFRSNHFLTYEYKYKYEKDPMSAIRYFLEAIGNEKNEHIRKKNVGCIRYRLQWNEL